MSDYDRICCIYEVFHFFFSKFLLPSNITFRFLIFSPSPIRIKLGVWDNFLYGIWIFYRNYPRPVLKDKRLKIEKKNHSKMIWKIFQINLIGYLSNSKTFFFNYFVCNRSWSSSKSDETGKIVVPAGPQWSRDPTPVGF